MTNYRKKLLWLYARKRGSGSGGISVSVSGTTPVTLANAIESAIRHMTQFGKLTQSGTPTTANPVDIVCNNGALKWDSVNQRIYADGTPEVLTVSADDVEDQTASVENLLAVGNVRDEQDIITGKVIRRTEVFKYDGTQTVKPTFMSTTGGKDDGAIIVQARGAEYAGDVVSFEAQKGENIDSLKVILTPKQEGSGDTSPDNIRPITGTDAVEVVRTGINLWDEEWETGAISVTTGENITSTSTIRSKNYISVVPNTEYYCKSPTIPNVVGYDADKAFVARLFPAPTGVLTIPEGVRYMRFYVGTSANPITEYNHDISINYPATDTAYHAYDPQSTTHEIEWGALGKNKLKPCVRTTVQNGVTFNATADGAIQISGTATGNAWIHGSTNGWLDSFVIKAGSYFLSGNAVGSTNGLNVYLTYRPVGSAGSGSTTSYDAGSGKAITFAEDVQAYIQVYASSAFNGNYTIYPQLELGSSASQFEPYTKTIYGGHVDAVRGEIVTGMAEVDLGDFTWNKDTNRAGVFYSSSVRTTAKDRGQIVADIYKWRNDGVPSGATIQNYNNLISLYPSYGGSYVYIIDHRFDAMTSAEVKTALAGVKAVYELAQPITLPLDPQTLTALQKNTVWADAGPVDVLLGDEMVETVAKQPLKTAEGDNTVSVVSEVGEVELAVTYKGGTE